MNNNTDNFEEKKTAEKHTDAISLKIDWLKALISAYERYLPARVIEKIKLNPKAKRIEGERRNVTVLFADLSGFTALSETMDAEEIANIINDFFTRMVKIVHKYEGSVDKFLGDALMVLFGAPVAHHDDPERAVRAALEMQEEMERFNAEKKFASPLSMSVGINSGPAVALNVGSDERMEYTVIGDTVNLAARLESVSGPKEIIISQFTYEKIADIVDAEKRPSVKVKGKRKPVVNYLVKGIREHYRLPEITKIKFIGRKEELEIIKNSLNQAKNNRLRILGITGEPGSGKTRLGIEAQLTAQQENFTTLSVRCMPYEMNIPYNVITGVLSGYFQVKPGVPEQDLKLKIGLKLKGIGLTLDEILPYIGLLYGMNFPELQALPPEELKKRTFNALKRIFESAAKSAPLFVRVEDLQWADPTSIEFFDYLLKELKEIPLQFFFEYRSDYAFPWLGQENCESIFLKNFTKEEANNFMQYILDAKEIPVEVIETVYEKSNGNPLFVSEIVKLLLKKSGIRRIKERIVPTEMFKKIEIAESVSSVILDRIDRMSELDKRTLQYASVIGRVFEPDLLAAILNTSVQNLSETLERLEHFEGVLVSDPTKKFYEFTSPTAYEVVYGSLFKIKRKELHTIIGNELEKIPEEKIYENLEKLAYHFARSNEERKGIYYLKSAADKSYRLYALKETLNFFDQALELLKKKELSPEEMQDKLEVLRRQGWVLRLLGKLTEAIKNQKQSLKLARKVSSLRDEAGANLNIGIIYQEMGIPKKGLNYWTRARRIAKKIGDKNIHSLAVVNLGNYYMETGVLKKALKYFNESLKLGEELKDKRAIGLAHLNLGYVIERQRDLPKALESYKRAHQLFEEIDDKENVARSLNQIGLIHLYLGNINEAIQNLSEVSTLASKIGDKMAESLALGNIGLAYAQMWQLDKAYENFTKSLTNAQVIGDLRQVMGMSINIGELQLYRGNIVQALEYHNKATNLAIQIQDLFSEALSRRATGWDYYHSADYKKAIEEFEKSQNIFQNIGDRRNSVISMVAAAMPKIKLGYVEEMEGMLKGIEGKAQEMKDLEVLAYVLDAEAELFIYKKDYENARKVLEQLPDLSRQIGNKRLYAWTMAKLAEATLLKAPSPLMGETPSITPSPLIGEGKGEGENFLNQSSKYLEQSLPLANEIGDKILETKIFIIESMILKEKTDYTSALNILNKAVEQAKQCGAKELFAKALLLTAKMFEKIGKKKEADGYQQDYNKVIEEITKDFSEEERQRFSLVVSF
ncbi:MAG: adenylate/guanylate cyclase domain-containing protein [candidate division WOR-3 bacterium]